MEETLRVRFDDVFQIGFVSSSRSDGMEALDRLFVVDDWITFEPEMDVEIPEPGKKMRVAAAFGRLGRVVVEVVEPLGGEVDVFGDPTGSGGPVTLHHLGIKVDDLDLAVEAATSTGCEVVSGGRFEDQIQFAFIDARPVVGHYLELVEFSDAGWQLIDGILSGKGPGPST